MNVLSGDMPTRKPKDGRRKNGSERVNEDAQLIRGPAELMQAMRERAERDGQLISVAWRRAAEAYLEGEKGRRK